MSIYKLTNKEAFVHCICGNEFVVDVSELEAHLSCIKLPRCESCNGKMTLVCYPIEDKKMDKLKEPQKSRHIINHTLFKMLVESGKFAKKNREGGRFKIEDVNSKSYRLAKDLGDGEEFEALVNRSFIKQQE